MFVRFRSARPTNDLAALRRFYVDALGCVVQGEFSEHAGFDGLIIGEPGGAWQVEFLVEHGKRVPAAPSREHLLVFYVADRAALAQRMAALEAAGFAQVAPNNPYWVQFGAAFADPDGYHVVIAVPPGS